MSREQGVPGDLSRRQVVLRRLLYLLIAILVVMGAVEWSTEVSSASSHLIETVLAVGFALVAVMLNEAGRVNLAHGVAVLVTSVAVLAGPVLSGHLELDAFYCAVMASVLVLSAPRRWAPVAWLPAAACWVVILAISAPGEGMDLDWGGLFVGGFVVTGATAAVFGIGWVDTISNLARVRATQEVEEDLIEELTVANERLERLVGERVAELEAVALSTDQVIEALRESSVRDHLTGLHNRRAFAAEGARMFSQASRTGEDLIVAVLDLDRFKQINDQCGHLAGDAVLRAVGAAMADTCRDADLVCRLGGDEFAIVMAQTDPAGADGLLRRLDAALARIDTGVGEIPVRATSAVATRCGEDRTIRDTLDRADALLLATKAARGTHR